MSTGFPELLWVRTIFYIFSHFDFKSWSLNFERSLISFKPVFVFWCRTIEFHVSSCPVRWCYGPLRDRGWISWSQVRFYWCIQTMRINNCQLLIDHSHSFDFYKNDTLPEYTESMKNFFIHRQNSTYAELYFNGTLSESDKVISIFYLSWTKIFFRELTSIFLMWFTQ